MLSTRQQTFEEDLVEAFEALRVNLRRLLAAAGVQDIGSGDVARRLGLNRNLTWKLAKVLGSDDIYTSVQHLPGEEGMEILAKALANAGAPRDLVDGFTRARQRLDRVVEVHTGDRATFDLIIDGFAGAGSGDRLEQSRKLAFRGNSGLWGMQAKVRSTTTIVAPNRDDPTMFDFCIVGGVVDFRRLRPSTRWPLFRPRQYHDDGSPIDLGPREEPVDPASASPESPMLIREFCSANTPDIRAVRSRLGWDYEMGDGPVGNLGAFTCFFGRIVRKATTIHRTDQDPFLDLLSNVTMPVETMLFDVLVHQDLPFLMSPKVMLLATMDGGGPGHEDQSIPLEARPLELMGRPPILSTQLIPRYDELTAFLFARGGWNPREFRALRLAIKYQPMHSVAVMRTELPAKP